MVEKREMCSIHKKFGRKTLKGRDKILTCISVERRTLLQRTWRNSVYVGMDCIEG
jgi:hypothetical protein